MQTLSRIGFRTLCAVTLLSAVALPLRSTAAPKQIVLEEPKQPRALDVYERLAIDNALLEGATDVAEPYVIHTANQEISQTFPVDAGKCYVLSGAFQSEYALDISYAFGRTANEEPLTDAPATGKYRVEHRAGVIRFCIDRPGTVRVVLRMADTNPTRQPPMEWVLVLGSRPETQAQLEARHRVALQARAAIPNDSGVAVTH